MGTDNSGGRSADGERESGDETAALPATQVDQGADKLPDDLLALITAARLQTEEWMYVLAQGEIGNADAQLAVELWPDTPFMTMDGRVVALRSDIQPVARATASHAQTDRAVTSLEDAFDLFPPAVVSIRRTSYHMRRLRRRGAQTDE
jgi:hypothetical protein